MIPVQDAFSIEKNDFALRAKRFLRQKTTWRREQNDF